MDVYRTLYLAIGELSSFQMNEAHLSRIHYILAIGNAQKIWKNWKYTDCSLTTVELARNQNGNFCISANLEIFLTTCESKEARKSFIAKYVWLTNGRYSWSHV